MTFTPDIIFCTPLKHDGQTNFISVSAGIDSIARRCTKEEFEAMSHEKLTDLVCRNLGCLVVIEEESRIVEEFYRLAKTEVIKAVRHRESTAAILKAFRARIEVLFAQPEDLRDQEELDDLCWKTHCLEKNHSCPADTCLDADEIVRRARVNIDKRKTSKITQFVDAVYRYFYGVEGANLASFTDFLLAQATPPTKYGKLLLRLLIYPLYPADSCRFQNRNQTCPLRQSWSACHQTKSSQRLRRSANSD